MIGNAQNAQKAKIAKNAKALPIGMIYKNMGGNGKRGKFRYIINLGDMEMLEKELELFEQKRGELEAQNMGKWILIYDSEVIDVFDSLETAATVAVERFGRGPYLIRQIGAPPVSLPASYMYHLA